MLALSRGEGQSIIIDGKIEIKVVKWSRGSVRLAIQAPREVSVDRDEVWRRIHPDEKTPLEKAEVNRQERIAAAAAEAAQAPLPSPDSDSP
ncbi:MAG: carbon storage regulator [Phycisphaerae bacterium]